MSIIQKLDLTGSDTANFILEGDGTGGSVAERLGISWADTGRKKQRLEERADMREALAYRQSKVETHRTHARERQFEVNTGRARALPTAPFAAVDRTNTAQFLSMAGRIAV